MPFPTHDATKAHGPADIHNQTRPNPDDAACFLGCPTTPRPLQQLAKELKTLDSSITYFAMTMLDVDGRLSISLQSRFAGWEPTRGPSAIELREAAPVLPHMVAELWDDLGEGWIGVTTRQHLALYIRAGGNALIEERLARTHFAHHVEPHAAVREGPLGFSTFDPTAREAIRHRPRPKHRRRIPERDGHCCQACRASEADGAELVVHHIRMFSRGGPTADENLITLCRPCHDGLDPHEDESLFHLPGGHMDRAFARLNKTNFATGVDAYRHRVRMLRA